MYQRCTWHRILDYIFPPTLTQVMQQPTYIVDDLDELMRYKEGELTRLSATLIAPTRALCELGDQGYWADAGQGWAWNW